MSTVAEAELIDLDRAEAEAMLAGDIGRLGALWSDDFIVNNPFNMVVERSQVLAGVEARRIAYSAFERTVEATRVSADVAVTMGRETVSPVGDGAVARRYTHVWRRVDGAWRLAARHASIVTG
jgi:ketosteroid isomerase-like protein